MQSQTEQEKEVQSFCPHCGFEKAESLIVNSEQAYGCGSTPSLQSPGCEAIISLIEELREYKQSYKKRVTELCAANDLVAELKSRAKASKA